MDLKLSCADFSFLLLPHDDVLTLVALLGIQGVDIGLFEDRSHIYPSHVLPDLAAAAHDLTTRVHDKGLDLADIFYQASSTDPRILAANHVDPEERRKSGDLFKRMVEFIQHCGASHLTAEAGLPWESEAHETSLEWASEELAWRVEYAQQVGLICAVEPGIDTVIGSPALTLQLLEMTPGLTLTLDYSHFAYHGIGDDESEKLVPHASHVHARGAYAGCLQSKFQDNVVDFPRMLRPMRESGYSGFVCVEYVWTEWERCNEVDNLSETIQMRDHLLSVDL